MNILYISLNNMNRCDTSPHYIYIIQKLRMNVSYYLITIYNNLMK